MMNTIRNPKLYLVAAAVVALLASGAPALAGESMPEEKVVSLVGCLNSSDPATSDAYEADEFTLIERESGDWISVKGSKDLNKHLGHTVKLIGDWFYDDMNNRYFKATSVTMLAKDCKE